MTDYQQIQKERSYASLQKIIKAAQSPMSYSDIADATGMNTSHVRTLISRNDKLFRDFGALNMHGRRKMNYFQSMSADLIAASADKQVIYVNKYDQLSRTVTFIDCKLWQAPALAEKHTDDYLAWAKQQRLERKSARTHVGIADYGAFV